MIRQSAAALLFSTIALGSTALGATVPVDLTTWRDNTPSNGTWLVGPGTDRVVQTESGLTVFFGDTDMRSTRLSGTMFVDTAVDNDFIGFVVSYTDGDIERNDPGFVLIEWKPGLGLLASRVRRRASGNLASAQDRAATLQEIGRGANYATTGWTNFQRYDFDLVFAPTNIRLFLDGVLELDIDGRFKPGSSGFYSFSQEAVTFENVTLSNVPLPAAGLLAAPALMFLLRRKKN